MNTAVKANLCLLLSFLLSVDDLVLCLYPPMDYSGVENNVRHTHTEVQKHFGNTLFKGVCIRLA